MTTVQMETKQAKIQEFADLLKQRINAVEKQNLNLDLSEYETALIKSPYKDWLRISTMLKSADIEKNIYNDFLVNPSRYKIVDDIIVYNENWQAEAEKIEAERIDNLHITKQDFYIHLCKPANITYKTLTDKIIELDMQAEWELCNHVYYGIIKPFLNALPLEKTEKEIIALFEKYTPQEN